MSTTVSGPPRVGRPPSRWARFRNSPHRTRWINGGLALLLVVAAVGAYLLIGNPSAPQQIERTAVVTRGSVASSVSGSGNAASQVSTPVSFESTGFVKEVDVKPGDTVTLGQILATIDPVSAQASLRTAQAQLDGAKAALAQAQSGATPVQAQQDALGITSAQQALDTAQKQLDQAHQQKDLDDKSSADAVAAAQRKLHIDQEAPCPTTAPQSVAAGADPAAGSSGLLSQKKPSDSSSSCNSKDANLAADRAAVTTAQNNQRNTELADEKAITSAEAAVTTAKNNVSSAKLAQQANQHPQTPAQIAQVQATVDSAQVAVDTASRGVDDTTLKAPQAGVVLAVNGKVGDSSGSSSATATGSGTSSTTATGSTSSSASSSASSAGSGFVVIANVSQLAITANIAEADASKIKLGQPAQITFPGTSTTATGSVVQITPQSTVTNNVVLYPIMVAVDSAPPDVGVGATASLSIQTSAKDSVLRVPTAAITTLGDRHTVTVRRDGTDAVVPVQIGVQGDTDTEILSGVAEGDTVVLPSATGGASNGIPGAPARTGG